MLLYVKAIMGLKSYDPSKPNGHVPNPNKTMSTARALEIAVKNGVVPEGLLTVRTLNRYARKYRLDVHNICAPTAATKLISEHPNHVHLVDFSVCEQYYLRDSDGKILLRPYTYKNKPNEAKQKVWAFALVDHYSNAKYIKYYVSPGESSEMFLLGCFDAWRKKDDSRFPFHGVPRCLYTDKGSAMMSERSQRMLKALNIECMEHMPGNPRAKGMVETSFRHLQNDFESELRLLPAQSMN